MAQNVVNGTKKPASGVEGSVCLLLKVAIPPFCPSLPSWVQISKLNMHWIFDPMNDFNLVKFIKSAWWHSSIHLNPSGWYRVERGSREAHSRNPLRRLNNVNGPHAAFPSLHGGEKGSVVRFKNLFHEVVGSSSGSSVSAPQRMGVGWRCQWNRPCKKLSD